MLMPRQEGPPIVMDEIPRTYYPGRGFLTDQQAYPTDPFNRAPRYGGGLGIPGAPGNLAVSVLDNYEIAGAPRYIRGNFAPSGAIIKAPHLDSPYIDEQIRRGFVPMTPPVRRPGGPQLPGFV